jgi:hypothetical protein
MNNAVHCYNSAGSRAYSLYLPAPLLTMVAVEVPHARMAKCLVLALANGGPALRLLSLLQRGGGAVGLVGTAALSVARLLLPGCLSRAAARPDAGCPGCSAAWQ